MLSEKYIDYKVTIWRRMYIPDEISKNDILNIVNSENNIDGITNAIDNIIKEYNMFVDEILDDTEEFMSAEENGGEATIELYEINKNHHAKWELLYSNSIENDGLER